MGLSELRWPMLGLSKVTGGAGDSETGLVGEAADAKGEMKVMPPGLAKDGLNVGGESTSKSSSQSASEEALESVLSIG